MKILVLSDLHNEFHPFVPPDLGGIDVVVLAGDIDIGTKGVEWANRAFPSCPVVMVLGNHEFYRGVHHKVLAECREAAAPHVHLLECDEVMIDGVRFLGTTLWTDFGLFGLEKRVWAVLDAQAAMTDYKLIRVHAEGRYRRMRPADTIRLHREARRWLAERLADPPRDPARTVVVTHHAPHPGSLVPAYAHDPCSAAYVSDLTELMGRSALWIHGHTHTSFDYSVSGTRVICNPRGYWKDELNRAFNPSFTVEIQP